MLRIIQNSTPSGAKSYYSTPDYYVDGAEQELAGIWRGKGAERLGLSGDVKREQWDALCDNVNPATGEPLTPRRKADRRVGYDFNFHMPKSVSLLYGLTRDERILQAFRESVDATMEDIEAEMQTRVRIKGKNTDRTTGNMVWGEFIHFTARPVDGVPDPHLHSHCFVFNTTWDANESRWKAGQFAGIKRDGEFFEAVFHSRLARRLEELGLPVERTKHGWELAGVPLSAVRKFSRRTALIEDKAREKGIKDPEAKGELGAKTRERKVKDLSMDELQEQWASRLSTDERAALGAVKDRVGGDAIPEDGEIVPQAIRHAVSHCFERNSVVPERKVLAEALKRSLGAAAPATVQRSVEKFGLVVGERNGRRMATTRDVLAEELRMVVFARNGRGTCRPLGSASHKFRNTELSDEQRRAVLHVLTSSDRVVLIRGGAGTGKTWMMREAADGIEENGRDVFAFAPSAGASRGVLREDGFGDAETVARLLLDERMQSAIRGQVIWIDEAGLLGTRTLAAVFDLADKLDARVVLSGDRRQHGSVERGAALRLLEEEAGLKPAELREIQRQHGRYQSAVRALSEGRTADGFEELDDLGWIKEVSDVDRYKLLAADYVSAVMTDPSDKAALVVAPTHLEATWTTDEIRARLKGAGKLLPGEHRVDVLENANLTEAERADAFNYSPGDVVLFHQNAKGYRKGQRLRVGVDAIPIDQARRFQVFRSDVLPVAPGERLRVTRNGKTADGLHDLNNGMLYTVAGFTKSGDIQLTNGWTIAKDYGHLAHGYVVTSHASQGKTVKRVFIAQSTASVPASSREQFYVSVSRGKFGARIYTDDKEALLEAVQRSDERLTAMEFVEGRELREQAMALQRRERLTAEIEAVSRQPALELDHER